MLVLGGVLIIIGPSTSMHAMPNPCRFFIPSNFHDRLSHEAIV